MTAIAIIGSRQYNDLIGVSDSIKALPPGTIIVSGGACGVDQTALIAADFMGFGRAVYLPDYAKYGRGAPLERNKLIAEAADEMFAFWDGESRGTRHAIDCMRKLGKPVRVRKT